jgi:membrane-associated phospholipid phosphatase
VRSWIGARVPRTPRAIALIIWAVAFATFCIVLGLPIDRGSQTVWILTALFAVNIGNPWRRQLRIVIDWVPFVGFLYLYDYTRGLAGHVGRPIQVTVAPAFDKWLFHGNVPTVWLQQHFYDPNYVHWYDIAVSLVYFSHFFVVWIVAAVLYVRNRSEWARWARRLLLLSYAGLITFVIYPSAPPWYAGEAGTIEPVSRLSSRGWEALGLHQAADIISRAQGAANDFAAVPSLHAAFTALLTVFVWTRLRRVGRTLMVVYTLAMALSLIYAGEHYVFDILIGYAYVAAVAIGATLWERRRDRRRLAREIDLTDAGRLAEVAPAAADPAGGFRSEAVGDLAESANPVGTGSDPGPADTC